MNRKIIVLGVVVCLLSVVTYSYYENITTHHRGGNNQDGTTYHYSTQETIYPYRNNSLIIAIFGVVTFLSGLAIHKGRCEK